MFMGCRNEISAVADLDKPDPLQKYKDAVLAIVDELKGLSALVERCRQQAQTQFQQTQSALQVLQ